MINFGEIDFCQLTLICTEMGFDIFDPPLLCSLEGHRILI